MIKNMNMIYSLKYSKQKLLRIVLIMFNQNKYLNLIILIKILCRTFFMSGSIGRLGLLAS